MGGNGCAHLVQIGFALRLQPFGQDVAGHDGVDGDAKAGVFERRTAHEAQLPGLACAVMRPARKAGNRPGDGRCQHDAPMLLRLHYPERRLHDEEHAFEIDVVRGVPVGFRHGCQRRVGEDAGVGAQDVQTPVLLQGRLYSGLATGLRAYVQGRELRAEFGCGLLARCAVNVGNHHLRACFAQRGGDAFADAFGCASDQSSAILE